jgi:hypothetical protein
MERRTGWRLGWRACALTGVSWAALLGGPADAQTPMPPSSPKNASVTLTAHSESDYKQRVVAYIHGSIPITREELGEYLIARYGYNKVELLVNRRIIEHACQQRQIEVTDAELEAAIDEDIKPFNVDRATFVKNVLRKRGQTLYEYKEDVIRPALMLKKLCQHEVKVEEEDLKRAFEARYGEKVRCRIILWPESEFRHVQKIWEKLRDSEDEFANAAKNQAIGALASVGGLIDPIGRGVADKPLIENIAFRLKPGEISEIFPITEQKMIGVLKCDGRIPPVEGVTLEKVREELTRMVFEQKVAKAMPAFFQRLRDEAKPLILIPYGTNNPRVVSTGEEEKKLLEPLPQNTTSGPQGK